MAMPLIICLKSVYNDKYLRYVSGNTQTHGLLQFSAENVMDPYAQFEVQNSETGKGLVHLKSRYTNKYLVRWSPNHDWITASADSPDEDQNSWTCTLFKPTTVTTGNNGMMRIRLMHVQLGNYACLWEAGFDSCLLAGYSNPDKDSKDVFMVIDWESIFKLPKRVAFKGDNGNFVGPIFRDYQPPRLSFAYNHSQDPNAAHEIVPFPDGTICIKSICNGKFWRCECDDQRWIVADAPEPEHITINTSNWVMFRPCVLDKNVVAIMNMGPTLFCTRDLATDYLNSTAENIDNPARLEVIDLDAAA